jgi:DNA-binding response OmpR family regulator
MRMENTTSSALILVVDDEELIRMFVREALERAGFEVCQASQAVEHVSLGIRILS